MRIWVAPYRLTFRAPIGGRARSRVRDGALLKIADGERIGYSDLHPWPELGDAPLKEQLSSLQNGKTTRLSARTLRLARMDLEARSVGVNAFQGLVIPQSHFTVTNISMLSSALLDELWAQSFRVIKIKLGHSLQEELVRLKSLESALGPFRLRFDFNSSLTEAGFRDFVSALPSTLRLSVEFVEDPVAWDSAAWTRLQRDAGLPLALDRASDEDWEGFRDSGPGGAEWLIVKPALQSPELAAELVEDLRMRLCVTSYLDHPVGQMGAALEAALLVKRFQLSSRLGICGLLSHQAFEPNEFSDALETVGPKLAPPAGTGIGFDSLLEQQEWKSLKGL